MADIISNDKFNVVKQDLKDRNCDVKKLIESLDGVNFKGKCPDMRNIIQEYFTSLNMEDLLHKEFESNIDSNIIENLDKFINNNIDAEDEIELDDKDYSVPKITEFRG